MTPPRIFGPFDSGEPGHYGLLYNPDDDLRHLLVASLGHIANDEGGALTSLARIRLGTLRPMTEALTGAKADVKDYLASGDFTVAFLDAHNGEEDVYGFVDRRRARYGSTAMPSLVGPHNYTKADPHAAGLMPDVVLHRSLAKAFRATKRGSDERAVIGGLIIMVWLHELAHLVRGRFGPTATPPHIRGVLGLNVQDKLAMKCFRFDPAARRAKPCTGATAPTGLSSTSSAARFTSLSPTGRRARSCTSRASPSSSRSPRPRKSR
jgi:hypothetical protein